MLNSLFNVLLLIGGITGALLLCYGIVTAVTELRRHWRLF